MRNPLSRAAGLAASLAALVLLPAGAAAQACAALPSLDMLRANIKAVYQDGDGVSAIGGGAILKFGAAKYIDLEYGRASADDADVGSHNLEAALGFETAPKTPQGWRLCPVVGVKTELLDDIDFLGTTISGSSWAILAGADMARNFGDPNGVSMSPFFGGRVVYSRTSVNFGGFTANETSEFILLQTGLGIHFTPTLALRPWVQVPVGLGEPETRIGVTLAVGVPNGQGRPRAGTP